MKNTDRLFPPGSSSVPMTAEAKLREARELLLEIEPNSLHWPKSAVDDAVEAIKRFTNRALRAARREALGEAARLMDDAECLPSCDSLGHNDLCPYVNPGNAIRALASRAAGDGKL